MKKKKKKKKNQNWGQQGIRSKQKKNKNTGSTHKNTVDKIKTKASFFF